MELNDELASKIGKNRVVLRTVLGSIRLALKVFTLPVIRERHPWTSPKTNQGAILPINTELQQEELLLPMQVASEFIERSSHRMIMDVCGCRQAYDCKHHSPEIGCLFMGESVLDIGGGLGRLVSKKEAHEHLRKAVDQGLVPATSKVRVDNFMFNIPDRGKLLTLCFCCHCCCMSSFYKDLPAEYLDQVTRPIRGLTIEVGDECTGCGTCLEYCVFDAISIVQGKAVHDDTCRGCGRCATRCPEKAVRISLDNPNVKDEIVNHISTYVDVT